MRKQPSRSRLTKKTANFAALAKLARQRVPTSQRARGAAVSHQGEFLPPENWYEPTDGSSSGYRIVEQKPGRGYCHAVTPDEIRSRLSQLPEWMVDPLDVVQLSRMTRKKQTFPCYGMQWGSCLYLYPIEDSLIEEFSRPPKPAVFNESKMYGGRWRHLGGPHWQLIWTRSSLRDFYLNNILIHELGHLLDTRNTSYTDRERFAEWFAVEHGYRPSRTTRKTRRNRRVRKRHHSR